MRRKTKFLKEQFLEVYRRNLNISATCRAIGINRRTFYSWIEKDKKFREKVDEVFEELIDSVENSLYNLALSGNYNAITFILLNKGSSRGWRNTSRSEVNAKVNEKIEIVIVPAEKEEQKNTQNTQNKEV